MNPWTTLLLIFAGALLLLLLIFIGAAAFATMQTELRKNKTNKPIESLVTALAELPHFETLDSEGHLAKVVTRKQLMDALQTWRKENR